MKKTQKAYVLERDLDHLEEEYHEAWVDLDDMFDGWESVGHTFKQSDKSRFSSHPPEKFSMHAFFDYLEYTDFPVTEQSWPIMSKRMIETLRTAGEFRHETFPITMIDSNINPPDINNIENHDYEIIHILEHLDVINHEESVYKISSTTGTIRNIDRLVLKTPPNGFPPVFRIVGYIHDIFISHDAKTALEKDSIKGLRFVPLDRYFA
jgi:hypothetical protein